MLGKAAAMVRLMGVRQIAAGFGHAPGGIVDSARLSSPKTTDCLQTVDNLLTVR